MKSFGKTLRKLRKSTYYPATNKCLSQTQFAKEVWQVSGIEYSYGTISQWEREKLPIGENSRYLLLSIIKVLVKFGGIHLPEEANELLRSANYRPINDEEISKINQQWVNENPMTYILPPHSTQKTALPAQVILSGRNKAKKALDFSLRQTQNNVHFIVSRGGIGKTALATALAWDYLREGVFDSIVWLPFGISANVIPEIMLANITLQIGEWVMTEGLNRSNAKVRAGQINGVLSQLKHLIVIDGVETAEHSDYLGQHLWQLTGISDFIVTSRVYPQNSQQAYICELDELDVTQSYDLLCSHAKKSSRTAALSFTKSNVQKIFNHIGGHPLTLGLLPELLTKFNLNRILNAIERGKYGAHHEIYATAWETLTKQAREALFSLCFASQFGIDEDFLTFVTSFNEDMLLDSLDELFRYNLIQTRGTLKNKYYNLHKLTIQFIQIWLSQKNIQSQIESIYIKLTMNVFVYWSNKFFDAQTQQISTSDIQNLLQTFSFSFQLPTNQQLSLLRTKVAKSAFFIILAKGMWHDWQRNLRQVLDIDSDDQNLIYCQLLNQLGTMYGQSRQLALALDAHRKAEILAEELGSEVEIAQTAYCLAVIYWKQKNYANAIRYTDVALESLIDIGTSQDKAKVLNLRGLLALSQNNLILAVQQFQQSIEWHRESKLVEDLLRTLNNLALAYQRLGYQEKVIEVYEQMSSVLAQKPNFLQETRLKLSHSVFALQIGQLNKAETILRSINLSYLRQIQNNFLVALTLNNLSNVLLKQFEFEEAESMIQEAIILWENMEEGYELANSFDTLGDILSAKGDTIAAIKAYQTAMQQIAQWPSDVDFEILKKLVSEKLDNLLNI